MPLRSQLFSGNMALHACLVNDAAHVIPDARGEHVALIQAALVRLRYLDPAAGGREASVYGKATASAVLAYKTDFNIVNRNYQTKADKIVGKMTIASLDNDLWVLDGAGRGPRFPAPPGPHPRSPIVLNPAHRTTEPIGIKPLAAISMAPKPLAARLGVGDGESGGFSPPLSDFPPDMQATIRRSNAAKHPGKAMCYPFVANHEGPLSDSELSSRFAKFPDHVSTLRELHQRMMRFNIWSLIDKIESVYRGDGSRGVFCTPFDHGTTLAHMIRLTANRTPHGPTNPYIANVGQRFWDSLFCRDVGNAHGERDSFREVVSWGPGLHICVTNAKGRARTDQRYPFCDFHIDAIQQGQVCVDGYCLPLANHQTIGHLWTVGPWLVKQPGEWLKEQRGK